jgi:hypothetical protein
VPRAAELPPPLPTPVIVEHDFVNENIAQATAAASASKTKKPAAAGAAVRAALVDGKREDYGAVPAYLKARQAKWAEEAAVKKKAEEMADVPAGMRIMEDGERLETLDMLRQGIADARAELGAMKLHVDIPSQIRRKADLEAKITKLEQALGVFSRPRVFVKIE